MAGPISGIGAQQQVPLATPFQPGEDENEEVRQSEESQPQEEAVSANDAAVSEALSGETDNGNVLQAQQEQAADADSNEDAPRGSVIDITV